MINDLTFAETEVLAAISQGKVAKQIAAERKVSENTIRTHIRELKAKLGARTLPHAVTIGIQRRLLQL